MTKACFILSLILLSFSSSAQDPVKWTYSSKKLDGDSYEVKLSAVVQKPWHIYSQTQPKDAIALPTAIRFGKNPLVATKGAIKEVGTLLKKKDETLGVESYEYNGTVSFVQKVQLKGKAKTSLNGNITYQVCNDQKCLPPKTVSFSLMIE